MKQLPTLLLLGLALTLSAACAPSDPNSSISKADARAQASKGDVPFDFCEEFGWYGDGICDDFCSNPDPDCDGDQFCFSDGQCASGERCNADEVCLSPCNPGEICPAVCAGFCVEDPEPGECWGAWTDEFGACRTPADGVYPDSCCFDKVCGGFANLPCDGDEWCSFGDVPDGASADMTGVCKPIPEVCIQVIAPVCGVDGVTYGNSCEAHQAGVDVDHEGDCAAPADICGGFANLPCDGDEWCSFGDVPDGASGDMSGVCLPRPEVCIQVFAPVCGRDGQTYSNECMANAAGVDAISDGACD